MNDIIILFTIFVLIIGIALIWDHLTSDERLSNIKLYRKLKGGTWYQHKFTNDATQLTLPEGGVFWARYGEINRYSKVIKTENYLS